MGGAVSVGTAIGTRQFKLRRHRPIELITHKDTILHDVPLLCANTFVIPCLGFVPAGNPVEAVDEHIGTMRMSIAAFSKPAPRADQLFAVKAKGESMIGAGIFDGDWLVVKLDAEPPKESIVVARLEGDVTVKRLVKDKTDGWFLKPENPAFRPLYAKDQPFEIVGQVLALQRSLT